MPTTTITYKIFIASSSDVPEERKIFSKVVNQVSHSMEALKKVSLSFTPKYFELLVPSTQRPQAPASDILRECDYLVMVFFKRWGSPTTNEINPNYTSGTAEEYDVAMNALKGDLPMRDIAIYFKLFSDDALNDSEEDQEQIREVIRFKERCFSEKKHLVDTFDTADKFEALLFRQIGRWSYGIYDEHIIDDLPPQNPKQPTAPNDPNHQLDRISSDLLRKANYEEQQKQEQKSELTYRDVTLINPDNSHAWQQLGLFYGRTGHSEKAFKAFKKALDIDVKNYYIEGQAANNGGMGIALGDLGKLGDARVALERCLTLYQELELSANNESHLLQRCHVGIAQSFSNLGTIGNKIVGKALQHYLEEKQKGNNSSSINRHVDNSIDAFLDAIKYYEKALDYDLSLVNSGLDERKLGLAAIYLNTGSVMVDMFQFKIYFEFEGTDFSAEYYSINIEGQYFKALRIYDRYKNHPNYKPTSEYGCLSGLGMLYVFNGNQALERKYFVKALRFARCYNMTSKYATAYLNLVKYYIKQDQSVVKNAHRINDYIYLAKHYAELTNNLIVIGQIPHIINLIKD